MIVFLRHAVKAKPRKNQASRALRSIAANRQAASSRLVRDVMHTPLVLASSSSYRRALLERLGLPFETISPDVDETPLPGESPERTARRLAEAKAHVVPQPSRQTLVIGSDQVAEIDGVRLGKPGEHEAAVRQLILMRGKHVVFHTALCLRNSATGRLQLANVPTTVEFRHIGDEEIERYLARERPYDCAGSARIEGLGIALAESVVSEDPTALIGLPLIALVTMLRNEGVRVV